MDKRGVRILRGATRLAGDCLPPAGGSGEGSHLLFSEWTQSREFVPKLLARIVPRLESARMLGFTSTLDLAPPPPPTLHWTHKPKQGEYAKVRSLTCYGGLHVWLLTQRLKQFDDRLCRNLWDQYWQLVDLWVTNASVPRLGSQGEVNHLKQVVGALTNILTDGILCLRNPLNGMDGAQEVDGLTVKERLGTVHYLMWLLIYKDAQVPIDQCVLLGDTLAWTIAQMRVLDTYSHGQLCETDWQWMASVPLQT